jgi:hypothetical protein
MSAAHIDISEFDDTALGAEVRHKHAEGHAMLILHDSSVPDRRAGTWVDGTRGLYKMECENGPCVAVGADGPADDAGPLQGDCPTALRCGRQIGVFVER